MPEATHRGVPVKLLFLVPFVLAVPAAHAEPEPPVKVYELLADPAALAAWLRDRDPHVDAARARVAGAYATSQQARVIPNPQLEFGASDFVIGKTTKDDSGVDAHLGVAQTTIFTVGVTELVELGKRRPRREAADLRVHEAQELAVASIGDRLSDATATLGKLAYVVARRDVVQQQLEAATKLRDNEKIRLDKQDLSAVEYARIELDTQALELQLGRAQADLIGATAACSAALLAPCAAAGLDARALDVGAPLPAQLPEPKGAITDRAERRASALEVKALGEDAELASHRKIPDLTLGIGYTLDNLVISGDQHQSLAFTVGIPLPLFDRGDHDAQAARSNARALELEDRAIVREAGGVLDALLAQRAMLTTNLGRLETEAVPKSTQIIQQTQRAFDLGQARLADLIQVQRAHRDLLLEVLDTRFELFNTRAQLRHVLGLDDRAGRGGK